MKMHFKQTEAGKALCDSRSSDLLSARVDSMCNAAAASGLYFTPCSDIELLRVARASNLGVSFRNGVCCITWDGANGDPVDSDLISCADAFWEAQMIPVIAELDAYNDPLVLAFEDESHLAHATIFLTAAEITVNRGGRLSLILSK